MLAPMCWMYQSRACSTSGTARCRWSNGSVSCACAGEHRARRMIAHATAIFDPFDMLRVEGRQIGRDGRAWDVLYAILYRAARACARIDTRGPDHLRQG